MSFMENLMDFKHAYDGSIFHTIVHSKPFNIVLALIILVILVKVIKFLFAKLTNALVKVSDDEGRRKQIKTLLNFAYTLVIMVLSVFFAHSCLRICNRREK